MFEAVCFAGGGNRCYWQGGFWEAASGTLALKPRLVTGVSGGAWAACYALAGIGPALIPRRVAAYGHDGRLVRLHPNLPFIPDTICLLYRADMHRTKAAMKVKDEIVAYGKKLDAT